MKNSTVNSAKPLRMPVREVCALIGKLALDPEVTQPDKQLGTVTLLPHQLDAVVRLQEIIASFGGALLADYVGLGKTFVALALTRDYQSSHVLAPAALLPMWRSAITRCEISNISVHSLHSASRCAPVLLREQHEKSLVIIDEAHHMRNVTTARYRNVSDAVAGFDLLLLSATPVHNTPNDLRALLALFLGSRNDLIEASMLGRLIVRRLKRPAGSSIPRVIEHEPLVVPHNPGTLAGIVSLPSPLPASDGVAAGALIRLGLLRAWCSSDAALTYALDRRLLRGEALRQALAEGRHPTNIELRSWLVGDHEVQLAFPLLMAAREVEREPLVELLELHLTAVRSLRSLHKRTACGDVARAQHLRLLRAKHSNAVGHSRCTSTLAFSQYTSTVKALYRALSDIAGVGMLTGTHGRIASGAISRGDVLHRFAPQAHGKPPPPAHQAIKLLLATDLIAEGVNLQDAGVVVHLDLPWTDALRQQRVGRVARLGALHSEVHIYTMSPPEIANEVLKLSDRLEQKASFANCTVGSADIGHGQRTRLNIHNGACLASGSEHGAANIPSNGRSNRPAQSRANSPAEITSLMRELLAAWKDRGSVAGHMRCTDVPRRGASPLLGFPVCMVEGQQQRALAAVEFDSAIKILAFHNGRLDDDMSCIVDTMQSIELAIQTPRQQCAQNLKVEITTILRALEEWTSHQRSIDDVGPSRRSMSDTSRELRDHIYKSVARVPPMRRSQLSQAMDLALVVTQHARGAAAERAMMGWLQLAPMNSVHEWLSSWRNWPALTNTVPTPATATSHAFHPKPVAAEASTVGNNSIHTTHDETRAGLKALILINPQPA